MKNKENFIIYIKRVFIKLIIYNLLFAFIIIKTGYYGLFIILIGSVFIFEYFSYKIELTRNKV